MTTTATYNAMTDEWTMSVTVKKPAAGATTKIKIEAYDVDFEGDVSDEVTITVN